MFLWAAGCNKLENQTISDDIMFIICDGMKNAEHWSSYSQARHLLLWQFHWRWDGTEKKKMLREMSIKKISLPAILKMCTKVPLCRSSRVVTNQA